MTPIHKARLEYTAPLPEPLTKAEIEARFPEYPEGWTAQQDLDLVKGLFKLNGLMRIAVEMGVSYESVEARFLQLRKAASPHPRFPFSLTAQSRLLQIVEDRAK